MYWKTKETSGWPVSARNMSSWLFLSSAFVKWFQLQPPPPRTPNQPNSDEIASEKNTLRASIPIQQRRRFNHLLLLSLHRLHLNVSCVSQSVSSLNWKSCLSASTEKWRSVSSISSTTARGESACFGGLALENLFFDCPRGDEAIYEACEESRVKRGGVDVRDAELYILSSCPSRQTRARAC